MAAVLKNFDRKVFEETIKQRFIYGPSFNIYEGSAMVAGLFDYGPMGCALKNNLLSLWRNHFVLEESMLEVDCSILTPAPVLKASGHVDKFSDLMVQDAKTNEYYRADHLLEAKLKAMLADKKVTAEQKESLNVALAQAEGWSQDEKVLGEKLIEYKVKSPDTGNDISAPIPFNLMFGTSIGPTGKERGFLRPETAQGIFVNFKRLLEFNQRKMPFAAAQIGTAFRNEISPRSGLLRVREFQMAEIEHFVNPNNKNHPKFARVADIEILCYSAPQQEGGLQPSTTTIGEAVKNKIIDNETLGYFLGRIYLFLIKAGIKKENVRFRQHMCTEMAHYATDCWDAELLTSYGWVECVGCADRSAFDLHKHSDASGTALVASENLTEPIIQEILLLNPEKRKLGPAFGKKAKDILAFFSSMDDGAVAAFKDDIEANESVVLNVNGDDVTITKEMVSFERKTKTITERSYTPNVIEPSFGIGRIIYAILEQNFYLREGSDVRSVLGVPPLIAPVAVSVLPLTNSEKLLPFVEKLKSEFQEVNVSCKVDDSKVLIGRRYARTDEIGVAFGCTIDFDTVEDNTVTLRERDTMIQVRMPLSEVANNVLLLTRGRIQWSDILAKYPEFK